MSELDVKTAELGHPFDYNDLRLQCKTVWGGVSFPTAKRPGFAVVVAVDRNVHLDGHDVSLLDERESSDTHELIRQCVVLDFMYGPDSFVGDYYNKAGGKCIEKVNAERERTEREQADRREYGKIRWESPNRPRFSLSTTPLLDMKEGLYPYILPHLRELIRRDQLFVKHGKVDNYLNGIDESEIAELRPGDRPAIEALAFAAIGGREYEEFIPSPLDRGHPMQGYAPRKPARHIHGQPKEVRVF